MATEKNFSKNNNGSDIITIKILNQNGDILAEKSDGKEVNMVYSSEYNNGDRIFVEFPEYNCFYNVMLDDVKGSSIVYVTDNLLYEIPFGEKRINISPKAFEGNIHVLNVRRSYDFEAGSYRNLALNVYDRHGEVSCYPHASANVETRGESVFAAMNAIDGCTVSFSHGAWPFQSWGINQNPDAVINIDFGCDVIIDRIILYTRADYPHDNWWKEITVNFSDGSSMTVSLVKTGKAQEFTFDKKIVRSLELCRLIKSDEPSPFPALTQIEVYGIPL